MLLASALQAQNLLPNSSFEDGREAPLNWQLKEGVGRWEEAGRTGKRCLSVTGDGRNSNYWFATLPALEPGVTYKLVFWGKLAPGTSGGCVVSGPDFCNKDWGLTSDWARYDYVFCAPPRRTGGVCRLGQWTVRGTVYFDDVELRRVLPTHHEAAGVHLGQGEQVRGTSYSFRSSLGGPGSNFSRLLESATASFNSSRWVFAPGSEVIYRQAVDGVEQTAARVTVMVGWYAAGDCLVEASRDQQDWKALGSLSATGSKTLEVPAALLPAPVIYVRLRSPGQAAADKDFAPGSFQVHEYGYEATLSRALPNVQGATNYLDIEQDTGQVALRIASLGSLLPGENALQAEVTSQVAGKFELSLAFTPGGAFTKTLPLTAGRAEALLAKYQVAGSGEHAVRLTARLDGKPVWQATTSFFVPYLYDNSYGYALRTDAQADLWWCEGTYKIAQERAAPRAPAPVRLAAARNEYEPCQVVLRPRRDLANVTAQMGDLTGPRGARIPADAFTIREVRYLKVSTPTDVSSCPGLWPDPLPPFKSANFTAGRNWPLWLTVKVPVAARAGLYRGALQLRANGYSAAVPIELQVYDFTLPARSHLQTAWGFSFGRVAQYQNLKTPEEREKVFDLYMQDFREHRIAPYDFFQLAPIGVKLTGPIWQGGRVVSGEAADGQRSLLIADTSDKGVVSASPERTMPVEKGVPYRLAWAVKTEKPDQAYQLTLGCRDAAGTWFSGRNIDLVFKGSGAWERQEVTLAPERFAEGCTQVDLALRPAPWTEKGENTGTAHFDDLFFGKVGGANLLPDPSFEQDASQMRVEVDWTAFDKAAAKYLDGYGFTSFRLPISFMPGGRYPDLSAARLGPFEEGTPEYERLFADYVLELQTHLEQKGWLDKAYLYWFDEPEPGDYEMVQRANARVHKYAPKLERMLTEQPEPALFGAVDNWCPVTPNYDSKACRERQKAGEKIWWYVCCGPKAPHAGLFIDHGATELRVWLWQTWQNSVQGCLVWESTWWDSEGSPARPQNPYTDPMGWTPEGGCWGNGDGRFIYPANADYPSDKTTYVAGPIDSIRWEMLREGLEDWEYLYLLQQAVNKRLPAAVAAAGLLEVPPAVSADMTHFAREPQPIYAQRARLAAALARCQVDRLGVK